MIVTFNQLVQTPEVKFEWDLTSWPAAGAGMHLSGAVHKAAKEQFPDLADMFPFYHGIEARAHVGDGFICLSFLSVVGAHSGGDFSPGEIEELTAAAAKSPFSHEDLRRELDGKWFSPERFTYIGPFRKPHGCWQHLVAHLSFWINGLVLPTIMAHNRQRIARAIPIPPSFDALSILNSLWVLESDVHAKQGTAFHLQGVGLVTCAHVIAPDLLAFRSSDPSRKSPIEVLKANHDLDLAILMIPSDQGSRLEMGTADNLNQMDHLMVAGFPNFRYGDTGIVTPGLVIGFRMVSGIRRILTDAPIVAGTSGGPVVGAGNRVIGIAVTGADFPDTADKTENHGVIPIDALKYLKE